ncbi:MAG: hypothetical protein JNM70_17635 [Anaerolineae bacterium]|nr:hypothetical protein [Anaerolineae bacterium]
MRMIPDWRFTGRPAGSPLRAFLICLVVAMGVAACGAGTPTPAPGPTVEVGDVVAGSFEAAVSGEVSGDFNGTATYLRAENGGILVNLSGTGGLAGATVSIILPEGTGGGQYTPMSYLKAFNDTENKITAVGFSFSVPSADGSSLLEYNTVMEGSLTLQSVDPLTGTFSVTCADENTGRSVTVSGTFNQIPVFQE